ncbi:hypothetical protein [Aeromonas sp. R6-2]|uniref:hypothetical protein n=1 Tax=Aeromonas sp. R6-2 TaxID=3138472 RepID=UPI0034A16E7E
MSNKTSCTLTLSIAMTGLIALTPGVLHATTGEEAPVVVATGGQCAAGKCGTEKRFEKQQLAQDPQDRLVRARDGLCGVSGEGLKGTKGDSKMTEGVCGN